MNYNAKIYNTPEGNESETRNAIKQLFGEVTITASPDINQIEFKSATEPLTKLAEISKKFWSVILVTNHDLDQNTAIVFGSIIHEPNMFLVDADKELIKQLSSNKNAAKDFSFISINEKPNNQMFLYKPTGRSGVNGIFIVPLSLEELKKRIVLFDKKDFGDISYTNAKDLALDSKGNKTHIEFPNDPQMNYPIDTWYDERDSLLDDEIV